MKGLLTTVLPASTAFLRYERYIGTSCEIRSMITSYGTGASKNSPPTFANSATTPLSRRFTSSMKAGGQDHSLPTNSPIRLVMETGCEMWDVGRGKNCRPMTGADFGPCSDEHSNKYLS